MGAQSYISALMRDAGVRVNGPEPWDIQVHDPRFFRRLLAHGSLGFGETYMEGWWDCADLDLLLERVLASDIERRVLPGWGIIGERVMATLVNIQTVRQSRRLADAHYNLSNEFFENMLGPSMAYSCAYWPGADTLDEAQEAKMELICRKIGIGPDDRVLDIGCGWGGFARHAAGRIGCHVTGVTVAREQAAYAEELCAGLPVEILCCDYRELDMARFAGRFDKVVSIGMMEHVGYRNYGRFMDIAHRVLRDGGLFLLHTIGEHKSTHTTDAWINHYIFRGGMLPSIQQIGRSIEKLFVLEDLQNIGYDYSRTLRAWHANFETYWRTTNVGRRIKEFRGPPEVFHRMWRYYLLGCAAHFRTRGISVWQLVLCKGGVPGGYDPVRSVKH